MTQISIENLQKAGWQLEDTPFKSFFPISKVLQKKEEWEENDAAILFLSKEYGVELFVLAMPNHDAEIVLNIQSMEDLQALERIFVGVTDWS